jgi:hypothetical protein
MKTARFLTQSLQELIEQLGAATMPEMKAALGTEVDLTVFRKLRPLDYLTSYSHRGSFYTLASIPRFDEQGLWTCRGAWFSRYGTLLNTVEAMINASPAGCFAYELNDGLHVWVKDALLQVVQQGRVHRQERQGFYFYTACNRVRSQEQSAARQAMAQARDPDQQKARAAVALFYSLLDEQQRRLYAGLESIKGGADRQIAQRLGVNAETVARGRRELLQGQVQRHRVRRAGGGRPRAEKKRPTS